MPSWLVALKRINSVFYDAQIETEIPVIEGYSDRLARKPEYVMQRISAFERFYTFFLYVKKPQEIFALQPSFVRDIVEAWEKARK